MTARPAICEAVKPAIEAAVFYISSDAGGGPGEANPTVITLQGQTITLKGEVLTL
jgi:hypothetical protein